ncbi:NAD(P)H-dependent flavin oxidoreductase [Paracoccus aminophilus]|uniref:Nitronate monooxygenase n=1 Tax=Paracoccus aminophilus JCM 7686 TaxID=1367847 RepID=S5XMI5_PARAH|nr:nitronate monooxygenase [Paracoccus aminophilus]AGT08499.1 2-nitropropane dioxygenase [Paracoccus aminophilus JCM 7686]
MTMSHALRNLVPIDLPIFQAPMAGVSTPALAAAVSEAGGLGALGLGASNVAAAGTAIAELKARTQAPFNVNFFCHEPARRDAALEARWIARMAPLFADYGAVPPAALAEIYESFRSTDAFLELVLATRPAVVSFHFGLPLPHQIAAMRGAGLVILVSATSLAEARAIVAAGCHGVIAQGWEAGGHRGIFDPNGPDERLSCADLTRLLVREISVPVIAAGGIMDGADIRRALANGAAAAQLGTAFVGCPESAADAAYRARMASGGETVMTRVISGRPARCLTNRFTAWGEDVAASEVASYPCAYDLGKSLNAAAKAQGESGFGAQWSGTQAARAGSRPAAELMAELGRELAEAEASARP